MKVLTKDYYRTIKRIEHSKSELVKKVYPVHKAGSAKTFLGIKYGIYKENLYSTDDVYVYSKNWWVESKCIPISEFNLENEYTVEDFDTFATIHKRAYIKVDDEIYFFENDETCKQYLSVLKGRCKENDNSIYKALDDLIID